ncbi:Lymphatic vessel endothelial hyaluronic acid receptor 1 [Bagarius yarrelli]|uniref:Lymphatic vessel endothelial hyaluronic acid receptor 1 n=1 Tax=Bagarius yarrelli TaxID=175774 RepID=A0A556TR11_BAGYA|nr:Lymphatic vessel endothelial hyaluronic acid receptor 1 [Bagarius yarrelli]
MRSRVCSALCSLLSLVLCTVSLDLNQIQVYPENGGTSGVFIVRLRNQPYSFNATTAVGVCTSLGVNIASRAQVETAQRNGLQTCRYGWVEENIAVIPRTEGNPNCGQNKVGIMTWVTSPERLFDVFCYNSTACAISFSKRPHRLSSWERICHKDIFETEMWKHTEQQHFSMQNGNRDCGDDITLQLEDDAISS